MKLPLDTGALSCARSMIDTIISANNVLARQANFDPENMMGLLDAAIDEHFDWEALPAGWADIMRSSMARVISGEQIDAVRFTGRDHAYRNDANGCDHYRMTLSFVDESGQPLLRLMGTIVEIHDCDGWTYQPSIDQERDFSLEFKGEALPDDHDDKAGLIESLGELLRIIHEGNNEFYASATQKGLSDAKEAIQEAMKTLREKVAELDE
jgi:hypothetical protein